jgi:hypothetical protein
LFPEQGRLITFRNHKKPIFFVKNAVLPASSAFCLHLSALEKHSQGGKTLLKGGKKHSQEGEEHLKEVAKPFQPLLNVLKGVEKHLKEHAKYLNGLHFHSHGHTNGSNSECRIQNANPVFIPQFAFCNLFGEKYFCPSFCKTVG